MRFWFILAFFMSASAASAQFRDSFDDGELNSDPAWQFSPGDFTVTSGRLNTANASGGTVRYAISARQQPDSANLISFTFQYGFNPSSQNYTEFHFSADSTADLSRNGFFIRAGDLRDEISLYRLVNGVRTEIISGLDGELNKSSNHYTVVVERRGDSLELRRMDMNTGQWYIEGTAHVPGFRTLGRAGIHVVQNGTSVIGKHFFDNLYIGLKPRDTTGPLMLKAEYIAPASVRVTFNEPLASASSGEFSITGLSVLSATLSPGAANIVSLQLNRIPDLNMVYTVSNAGSSDLRGNKSRNHSQSFFTRYHDTARRGDLFFSEVMAAPTPPVAGLPDAEYVEIFNPTRRIFTLNNYTLSDASTTVRLPDTSIYPGTYLTLSRNTFNTFAALGPWAGLSSFPSLNNDGDDLYLRNHRGELICMLSYSSNWHSNGLKKAGGWSLELRDTAFPCVQEGNWTSNTSGGGTPGQPNSAVEKLFNKVETMVSDIYVPAPDETELHFTRPVDSTSVSALIRFSLENGTHPLRLNDISDDGITVSFRWNTAFVPNFIHSLNIGELRTCGQVSSDTQTVLFGRADTGRITSVYINEILFDPKEDGEDYVELYNTGSSILDMNRLILASADEQFVPEQSSGPLGRRSLLPGHYLLLAPDPGQVAGQYPRNNRLAMMKLTTLPPMSNDEGRIKLIETTGRTIDSLYYEDGFHSPLLVSSDGVSLEKIRSDAPSNRQGDWSSATESSGFGTPGLPNSRAATAGIFTQVFSLAKPAFSPDNDGLDDHLELRFELPQSGYFITMTVFGENGYRAAIPFSNFMVESSGSLFWDGRTDGGMLPPGNYVARVEGFHTGGDVKKAKLTFSINSILR